MTLGTGQPKRGFLFSVAVVASSFAAFFFPARLEAADKEQWIKTATCPALAVGWGGGAQ